jgi:hypothetical protein
MSFTTLAALAWKTAIGKFVERLQPSAFVGLYAYPAGGSLVPLTRDHAAVLAGVDGIVGRFDPPILNHQMSLSEMVDITARDPDVLQKVAERECPKIGFFYCRDDELPREALAFAHEVEVKVSQSIGGLRALMRSLRDLHERKTVVVVSGGLPAADRLGGRVDVNSLISELGREAAESNSNLHVLHLDTSFIEMFSPRNQIGLGALRDGSLLGLGLDRFAGIAGGSLIQVQAGNGDYAFERVIEETSAYYLLGVEPDDGDRDGRAHRMRVKVDRRDISIRSRGWVVIPAPSITSAPSGQSQVLLPLGDAVHPRPIAGRVAPGRH